MNVLFVTRGFPSETDIMVGNYEAVQAKAIAAKGCHVSVMSIKLKSVLHLFSRGKTSHRVVDGIDVYLCTRIRFSTRFWSTPKLDSIIAEKAYRQVFKKYVDEKGIPDVVHAHIVSVASPVYFMKEEYHLPFVITEHWTAMNRSEISDWLKQQLFIYHHADCVICVSQALSDSLKQNFNVNSIVINNMVSEQFFKSIKIERSDNTFRFVACGAFRANRNKGFDILVDAFAHSHFPQTVSLTIIGDGPDRKYIESKIADYGLSDQIQLLGTKTPEEVNDILCHSDCFVLSSRLETFAIVVIEAMAKGLPVIATRSGGPETFLKPEHGVLVDKENVEQLTQAMKYMTEHYIDYNSDEIRQYCYEHFSQDVIADQIIGVYNTVLSNN